MPKKLQMLFLFFMANQILYAQLYNIQDLKFSSNIRLEPEKNYGFKVKRNQNLILTFNDSIQIRDVDMFIFGGGLCAPERINAPVIFYKNKLCVPIPLIEKLIKQKFLDENLGAYYFEIFMNRKSIRMVIFTHNRYI